MVFVIDWQLFVVLLQKVELSLSGGVLGGDSLKNAFRFEEGQSQQVVLSEFCLFSCALSNIFTILTKNLILI
ncbi:hypothetical protein DFO77_13434 [Marinilabilia salmonicolor]|uniref:Uncharacterized protein n=1 Tax=Marinilabilia salmonicolor TaxID=989 RepID=A0A368ULN2_9BACT|nr:hypothetical protein DFO77_13434 [Marinilabilia salmonicolor]